MLAGVVGHLEYFGYIDERFVDCEPQGIAGFKEKKTILLTMRYYIRIRSDEDWNVKFGDTIRYLQSLGHEVIVVGDIPNYFINPEDCIYGDTIEAVTDLCSMPKAEFDAQLATFEPEVLQLSQDFGVPYVTIHEPLCDDKDCNMVVGNQIMYRDDNHLNIPGSTLIGRHLSMQLRKVMDADQGASDPVQLGDHHPVCGVAGRPFDRPHIADLGQFAQRHVQHLAADIQNDPSVRRD